MVTRLAVVFAFLLAHVNSSSLAAQPSPSKLFYNLGLEEYTPEGYPLNWYIEAEETVGAEGGSVAINSDSVIVKQGKRALRISTKGSGPTVLYAPLLPGDNCVNRYGINR